MTAKEALKAVFELHHLGPLIEAEEENLEYLFKDSHENMNSLIFHIFMDPETDNIYYDINIGEPIKDFSAPFFIISDYTYYYDGNRHRLYKLDPETGLVIDDGSYQIHLDELLGHYNQETSVA